MLLVEKLDIIFSTTDFDIRVRYIFSIRIDKSINQQHRINDFSFVRCFLLQKLQINYCIFCNMGI